MLEKAALLPSYVVLFDNCFCSPFIVDWLRFRLSLEMS